jgi:LacI family transcriptional regulator
MMCAFDNYATEALVACSLAGLRVPEDVSVIGVDNDEMICMTTTPQLSSVATPASRIGQEAVRLVLSLIAGQAAPSRPLLLPPGPIIMRGSSSEMAVVDSDVIAAMHFIRARIADPIGVNDIVEHVAISRRSLERRFHAALRRTPLEQIRQARIERAKQLLIETDLGLREIAQRSGLIHQQRLSTLMKEITGQTPRAFRLTFRQAR